MSLFVKTPIDVECPKCNVKAKIPCLFMGFRFHAERHRKAAEINRPAREARELEKKRARRKARRDRRKGL